MELHHQLSTLVAAARAALCKNVTARQVWPAGVGLMGQWQNSKTCYSIEHGSVSFRC